jgi:hypothetical protein
MWRPVDPVDLAAKGRAHPSAEAHSQGFARRLADFSSFVAEIQAMTPAHSVRMSSLPCATSRR